MWPRLQTALVMTGPRLGLVESITPREEAADFIQDSAFQPPGGGGGGGCVPPLHHPPAQPGVTPTSEQVMNLQEAKA